MLTAQTALYTAQQSLVTARLERLQNLVTLYQALGGGWIEHTGEQPRPADAPVDYGAASAPVAASAAERRVECVDRHQARGARFLIQASRST